MTLKSGSIVYAHVPFSLHKDLIEFSAYRLYGTYYRIAN